MATFLQIRAIRLATNDPAGAIDIVYAADPSALPLVPAQQTAYFVQSTGRYVMTDVESDALPADYVSVELLVSDSQISAVIAAYGVDKALCKMYGVIATKLGGKLRLASTSSGAESSSYVALRDAYAYYKDLAADCLEDKNESDNNTTGRWGRMHQPRIAGGNV